MSKSEISVLKVTRLRGDRPLKAHVDVQIGSWVINDRQMVRSLSLDVLFNVLKIHISSITPEKQGNRLVSTYISKRTYVSGELI